jgi:hypothetical protein
MCTHWPTCPSATESARYAAHVVSAQPAQGWSLLCNGIVVFEDTGALLPSGECVAPARPAVSSDVAAA